MGSHWFNVLDITPEGGGSLAFSLPIREETHMLQHKSIYFLVNIVWSKDIMSYKILLCCHFVRTLVEFRVLKLVEPQNMAN